MIYIFIRFMLLYRLIMVRFWNTLVSRRGDGKLFIKSEIKRDRERVKKI